MSRTRTGSVAHSASGSTTNTSLTGAGFLKSQQTLAGRPKRRGIASFRGVLSFDCAPASVVVRASSKWRLRPFVLRLVSLASSSRAAPQTTGHERPLGRLQRLAALLNHGHHMSMRAYSEDLRRKIVEAVQRGMGHNEAAHSFGVSLSSVKRYVGALRKGGSLRPKKHPGSKPKIDERGRRLLQSHVEEGRRSRSWRGAAFWSRLRHAGERVHHE